jgi:TNF receptor-associated factor 4
VGQLGGLPQHLNIKPQGKDDRLSGCRLAKITCAFCSDDIQRKDLKEHEEENCTKRPYSCEYCGDYESIFEDVTTTHWPECRSRPVPCPNECGASPKFELLDYHVEQCPLQVIDCPFKYAGCEEKLSRKDMPDHITQSLALHMSLQATSHQQELRKLTSRISELEATVKLRELEVKNLLQGVVNQQCKIQAGEEIKQDQKQALDNHPAAMEIRENQSDIEPEILKHMKSIVHNFLVELVPFSFSMPDFEQKRSTNCSWYCASFYTHPRGYKMCLRVEANGLNDGKNSHVSVYLYMMRGEYDESLKWPFRGDVTVQLLNQLGGGGHHTRIVGVTEKSDDNFCKRVVLGERSPGGWGYHDFVSHSYLPPLYLKDDCLKFCIKEVKLNS